MQDILHFIGTPVSEEVPRVLRRFIGALTKGGPGGMPRPIEMHAHDPRRFLSDMLAWVHQVRDTPELR